MWYGRGLVVHESLLGKARDFSYATLSADAVLDVNLGLPPDLVLLLLLWRGCCRTRLLLLNTHVLVVYLLWLRSLVRIKTTLSGTGRGVQCR